MTLGLRSRPAALRGQGLHLTFTMVHGSGKAWLTLDVQEDMLGDHGTNEDTRSRSSCGEHVAGIAAQAIKLPVTVR